MKSSHCHWPTLAKKTVLKGFLEKFWGRGVEIMLDILDLTVVVEMVIEVFVVGELYITFCIVHTTLISIYRVVGDTVKKYY